MMINVCLVGLGSMGKLHFKNIKKLEDEGYCKIKCICDSNKEITDKFSLEYGIAGYYNVQELIEGNKIDAAIIATTSSSHFEIAEIFLQNKIGVLIEKPVCLNEEEIIKLKVLSEKKRILVSAGYTEVYNSVVTGISKYLLDNNGFDYIDFLRIGQKSERNKYKDIDVIQDLTTHDLAVLYNIIDIKSVTKISGMVSSYNEVSKMNDFACINLQFSNSNICRILSDRNGTIKIRKLSIANSSAFGEFDFMDQTANINKSGNLSAFGDNIWYSQNYNAVKVRYSNNPLYDELKDFITAVALERETKTSDMWFDITMLVEKIRQNIYN